MTMVADISTDGAMKYIKAPAVVLTATLTTGAPASRVEFLRTSNATVTLGGGAGRSSVTIREAAIDTDLISAAPIDRLQVGTWEGADGDDLITAPSIARATMSGVFRGPCHWLSPREAKRKAGMLSKNFWLLT